jgi:hypothetical protein
MVLCSGCRKDFKNSQGLTKHRNTCTLALQNTARIFQKRNAVAKRKELEGVLKKTAEGIEGMEMEIEQVLLIIYVNVFSSLRAVS